ncbi:MAG: NAD-dependent epimerase/dehydratase family protein [Sphaerochaeta sp.]|jgi:nucleoside-diphosphate-sugar epimerase|uniref:NAD-dependent epimerase/dehydratase family protein n=2 Tax=unclassified Sphaerochaeta TaxID=2637943 RepID=UPI003D13D703
MRWIDHALYQADLDGVIARLDDWSFLRKKTVLIVGATGMIGSFLVDLLMKQNDATDLQCHILAVGRDAEKAKKRFSSYAASPYFSFYAQDINAGIHIDKHASYIIHAASNTHPVAYATDPIGTILTNITGTNNLLAWAAENGCERFLFASSVEVYGENRGDVDAFDESYLGYLDSNTLRAGYPESKRVGEALCQAYRKQCNLDIVIARFSRVYGPTMLERDSKAIAQFLKNGLAKQDIVLKSEGNQLYSYTYVSDAVFALLLLLYTGEDGTAYNVADTSSDCTLRDLASLVASHSGTSVVFDLPSEVEKAGYSKATKAILDAGKIQRLGYVAAYPIQKGIERTLDILSDTGFFI